MKYLLLSLSCALLLTGCMDIGPKKPLGQMAKALEEKNSALFLAQIDGKAFAAAAINTMTMGDPALRALDSMGKKLGLGGMDQLINSVVNMQARQTERFTRGVSTGELMLQCRAATTPDCPWVPEALNNAKVTELSPDAAVAQVTTPTNITSWLALRKMGENWLVVGQAPLQDMAQQYAQGDAAKQQPAPTPAPQPQAPAQPKAPDNTPNNAPNSAPDRPQQPIDL